MFADLDIDVFLDIDQAQAGQDLFVQVAFEVGQVVFFDLRQAFQYFKTSQSSALAYILLFIVIVLTNLYLYFVNRRAREA